MNENPSESDTSARSASGEVAVMAAATPNSRRPAMRVVFGILATMCGASLVVAWLAWQEVRDLEQVLAGAQQDTQAQSTESRVLAKQAQGSALESAAKVALLEAKVAEVAVKRGQFEDLLQSLSRSRDENLLVDIKATVRIALQHSALLGSAQPLVSTLHLADERLARRSQPRFEGIRQAIARDLDTIEVSKTVDIGVLNVKLDDAVRMANELPLLSQAKLIASAPRSWVPQPVLPRAAASGASAVREMPAWLKPWSDVLSAFAHLVWSETKSLVRVTRIDHPEAVLMAPEQAFYLRENLKLRLLNARLALLARQVDIAQSDLRAAQTLLERYFDRGAADFALMQDLLRQAALQARQVDLPQPDNTLAALTAAAGR